MMSTFVDTATNLPAVSVCDNLRQALITNGFVGKVRSFIMLHAPLEPPPWSPALYPKTPTTKKSKDDAAAKLREEWRNYFERPGLVEAIKILIGLCSKHHGTQIMLAEQLKGGQPIDLPTLCHWVESTSDNESHGINMNGLGILAEVRNRMCAYTCCFSFYRDVPQFHLVHPFQRHCLTLSRKGTMRHPKRSVQYARKHVTESGKWLKNAVQKHSLA
jgi:hypothetical protein